jgi:hypothetical protein
MVSSVLILVTTIDQRQTKFQRQLVVAVCSVDGEELQVLGAEVI